MRFVAGQGAVAELLAVAPWQSWIIVVQMGILLWSKGANSGSGRYDVECKEDDHSVILELELGEVLPYFTLTLYSGRSFSKYLAFLRILTTSSFGSAFITFPL